MFYRLASPQTWSRRAAPATPNPSRRVWVVYSTGSRRKSICRCRALPRTATRIRILKSRI